MVQLVAAAAILMITIVTFIVMVKEFNDDNLRLGVVVELIVTGISYVWLFTAPFKHSTMASVVFATLPVMAIMTYYVVRTVMSSDTNRTN